MDDDIFEKTFEIREKKQELCIELLQTKHTISNTSFFFK